LQKWVIISKKVKQGYSVLVQMVCVAAKRLLLWAFTGGGDKMIASCGNFTVEGLFYLTYLRSLCMIF
jgi:hypothetical protein